MDVYVATRRNDLPHEKFSANLRLAPEQVLLLDGTASSVVELYQQAWVDAATEGREFVALVHDDVIVYEDNWTDRVVREFSDPTVGLVGFGGGTRLGHPHLYRVPYRIDLLARSGYRSNTRDAEQHGERFVGSCNVAVLDGFALFVRRELLDKCGGWPAGKFHLHGYDLAMACYARRYGYRTRMVGVDCFHAGGQTSTQPAYQEWLAQQGTTDAEDHAQAHRWLAREFADVLPFEVEP